MALGWSEAELEHVVRAYLRMLEDELAGREYVTAEYNREVQSLTGRSRSSIEFKFGNVSWVMDGLGLDWVQGYLPRFNYQHLMVPVCERLLAAEFPHLRRISQHTKSVLGADRDELAASALTGGRASIADDHHNTDAWAVGAMDQPTADVLRFRDLWERACGGATAAVSMHTEESAAWPKGLSAPGGDEVLTLVRSLHGSRTSLADEIDVVFLVGGPGNGKSELLRKAKRRLAEVGTHEVGVASRRYNYQYEGGHRLIVVNDASIPAQGKESADGELIADVTDAIESQSSILLAVNRGRLDDRTLHAVDSWPAPERLAREVLRWVHDTSPGTSTDGYVSPIASSRWDRADGLPAVRCFVVLMDACSLLETRPVVTLADGQARAVGYTIAPLPERASIQEESPGGKVLRLFVEQVSSWASDLPEWHPVRCNVEGLNTLRGRAGVGTWLRAGELAGGRKLTYRELWGAYVRCVLGYVPEVMTAEEALEKVLRVPEPTSFQDLRDLASIRTHQALAEVSPVGIRLANATDHPILRLTTIVDPVRDAAPSWARPVHEAMAFRDPDVGPLATLCQTLEENGEMFDQGSDPKLSPTPFDVALDDAFVEEVKELDPPVRREAEAWYGSYLLRLYATAIGQCAFSVELELWAREWRSSQPFWQEPLAQALRTLLFPTPKPGASMLLPALQPRAVPLLSAPDTPQLVRQVNPQHILQKVRRGDDLSVRLDLGGFQAEIGFDFELLREAMACAGGGPGITHHAAATLPRLERFRAMLLRHDSGQGYAVVDRENVTNVETSDVW